MSITLILKISAAVYLAVILIDALITRSPKRFALQLLPLLALILLDIAIATGTTGVVSFGAPASPSYGALLILFLSILAGIAAHYIFYLKGAFAWLDFLKPLCISPLLLLPLMGSLQSAKELEPIQLVSFALLAFQNGFFWQSVLAKSTPRKTSR